MGVGKREGDPFPLILEEGGGGEKEISSHPDKGNRSTLERGRKRKGELFTPHRKMGRKKKEKWKVLLLPLPSVLKGKRSSAGSVSITEKEKKACHLFPLERWEGRRGGGPAELPLPFQRRGNNFSNIFLYKEN